VLLASFGLSIDFVVPVASELAHSNGEQVARMRLQAWA